MPCFVFGENAQRINFSAIGGRSGIIPCKRAFDAVIGQGVVHGQVLYLQIFPY